MLTELPSRKDATRRRIVRAAAESLRTTGLSTTLRPVLRKVGLTTGAFYKHFESRDDMIVAALASLFQTSRGRWDERLRGLSGTKRVEAMVDYYLSASHADRIDEGCPVPSVLSELTRESEHLRGPFSDYRNAISAEIAEHLPGDAEQNAGRAQAIVSLCIGALSSARAMNTRERRDEVLQTASDACRLLIHMDIA